MFHYGCSIACNITFIVSDRWPIRESSNAFIALVVDPQGRCGHKRFLRAQKATDFVEVSGNSNSNSNSFDQQSLSDLWRLWDHG